MRTTNSQRSHCAGFSLFSLVASLSLLKRVNRIPIIVFFLALLLFVSNACAISNPSFETGDFTGYTTGQDTYHGSASKTVQTLHATDGFYSAKLYAYASYNDLDDIGYPGTAYAYFQQDILLDDDQLLFDYTTTASAGTGSNYNARLYIDGFHVSSFTGSGERVVDISEYSGTHSVQWRVYAEGSWDWETSSTITSYIDNIRTYSLPEHALYLDEVTSTASGSNPAVASISFSPRDFTGFNTSNCYLSIDVKVSRDNDVRYDSGVPVESIGICFGSYGSVADELLCYGLFNSTIGTEYHTFTIPVSEFGQTGTVDFSELDFIHLWTTSSTGQGIILSWKNAYLYPLDNSESGYNSTSIGTVEWRTDSAYVGQYATFVANANIILNPNLDVQIPFLSDSSGYVMDLPFSSDITLPSEEFTHLFYELNEYYQPEDDIISFYVSEPGTETLYLYEYCQYYDSEVGLDYGYTRLLASDSILYTERPSSDKSEIWSNSEFVTNNSIRFFWDIVDYDDYSYSYRIELDPDPDNMPYRGSYSGVDSSSGYMDQVYYEPGTYTVHLQRLYHLSEDWSLASDLDSFTFTIEMDDDDDDDILDPPEEPNGTEPGPIDPPIDPEINETLNSSLMQAYYDSVNGSVNGLHSSLSGIISLGMSPVNSMGQSVTTMSSIGTSSINTVSMYLGPVGVMLTVLFSSLPDEVVNVGTFFIFLIGFVFIWRGAQ